jgi:uncharacterized membrane protein
MSSEQNSMPTAKVIYILLIVGTIVGITGIIGLIMAYVMKDGSDDWIQSHYRFQIRTFWIGLLYSMTGVLPINIGIGFYVLLFAFVWLIVRCSKGLKQLENREPVKNLESWFFT